MNHAQVRKIRRSRSRGQAMLEYSIINWLLVVALVIGATVKIEWEACSEPGCGQSVIDLMLSAYQVYYDSYYFVLNMPFP